MGRALLIILFSSIAIYMITTLNVSSNINTSLDASLDYFSDTQARNIANSMVQIVLTKIADDPEYRVLNKTTKNLFGGIAEYTVKDTIINSIDLISINVDAEYYDISKSVKAFVFPPDAGYIPDAALAAISTNNPILTLGTMIVDGRDHDKNGALIPGNGTYGIWTTSTFTGSGNSQIGGTSLDTTDYVPEKNFDPSVVAANQVYPGGYPDSPDSILGGTAKGFLPGTLKNIAISGDNGSQYTTNPATLTLPLQGVTYVELPSGDEWNPATINGSGILIIHNSATNAIIKNINSGTFRGIVIADDIVHIHADIIGAVIGLTPTPSDGNCIGNGSGQVLYSSEAIKEATGDVAEPELDNYGFAKTRVKVYQWYE